MLKLTISDIIGCVNSGISDATSDYPLGNVPWPAQGSSLPQFDRFPTSIKQICAGNPGEIHSLGVPFSQADYGLPGLHNGTDFFMPVGSDVCAVADNGLVVGIGVEGFESRSAGNWGATEIADARGYSVIVRYGHLYILYGHLQEVDSQIYVGKRVDKGVRLGEIGNFRVGRDPHLHLEIRSFGANVGTGKLVVVNGSNNIYGILELGGGQANNMYDILQFFSNTTRAREIDTDTQTLPVSGLGINIIDGNNVSFSGTPVNNLSCTLPLTRLYHTQGTQQIAGYRGFVNGQGSVQVPEDPNTITQL